MCFDLSLFSYLINRFCDIYLSLYIYIYIYLIYLYILYICLYVRRIFYLFLNCSQVLTGSEVESDYKEPDTMDTRVVMGQETLLKTSETQKGKTQGPSSSQAIPLPGVPDAAAPQIATTDTQMDTAKKESQHQSPMRGEAQRKGPERPPNSFPSPLLKTLIPAPSSSAEFVPAGENPGEGCTPSQNEVPSASFPELAYPVVLSFLSQLILLTH